MQLGGKAALVTGGGTGLGRAVVLALAREGCNVAVNYPGADEEEAFATMKEALALGVQAIAVRGDVSQPDQVRAMVAQTREAFGHVDVLVNNAGTTVFVPMRDLAAITAEHWDTIMGVNVKGAFFCAQAVAPIMQEQPEGGRIVNVASVSGLKPGGSSLPYSVSKHAVIGLTRCLALALGPAVLVNAVAPGYMPTRWGRKFGPEAEQRAAQTTLIKRAIRLEEVAEGVLSLAKNDAVTGQTLVVDGGVLMH